MPNVINAQVTPVAGLVSSADGSGVLNLQTGGVTAVSIDTAQNVRTTRNLTVGSTTTQQNITLQGNANPQVILQGSSGTGALVSICANGATPQINSFDVYQDNANNAHVFQRANAPLNLGTNGATKMTILGNGYVGFNETNPLVPFVVAPNNLPTADKLCVLIDTRFSIGGVLVGNLYNNQTLISGIKFNANSPTSGSISFIVNQAIEAVVIGTDAAVTFNGPRATFNGGITQASSGYTNFFESDIVASITTGNFYIGNTNANYVIYNSTGAQSINGGPAYQILTNAPSDYRLKSDIKPIENALDKVNQLNPVSYILSYDGLEHTGFIAHELQEIEPRAVRGNKDEMQNVGDLFEGDKVIASEVEKPTALKDNQTWRKTKTIPKYQGVDTTRVVALLAKSIQELSAQVADLQATVKVLSNKK
jgi:hypothetical protein